MTFKTFIIPVVLFAFFCASFVNAKNHEKRAMEDYDATESVLGPEAGTSLVHDIDQIKQQAIHNIIRRIQQGDELVLKFITYSVFQQAHRELVQRTRRKQSEGINTDYYRELGGSSALSAFLGGLDNQDPKIRLRVTGFAGDWVDDIGEDLPRIAKAVVDRLGSGLETREEVKYALELIQLKILRKISLNSIFDGDEELLRTIDPEEFIVLVHGEQFIREIFCVPTGVVLRSVRLDPWWVQQQNKLSYRVITDADFRTSADEEEKVAFSGNEMRSMPFLEYRYALDSKNSVYRNYPVSGENAYGYRDRARYLDIVSLYDFRYFRYSEEGDKYPNEMSLMRSLLNGLSNDSLFVRENVARLIVRLSDGPVGSDRTSPPNVDAFEDPSVYRNPPYEVLDSAGRVISAKGNLAQLARSARYQKIALQAWDRVKYSQYVDVHLGFEVSDPARPLDPVDGTRVNRVDGKFQCGSASSSATNPWGYTYNYRVDVADILRRLGLGRYVDTCDRKAIEDIVEDRGGKQSRFFVEDLFDPDFFDEETTNQRIPLWHGRDEIRDEVFEGLPQFSSQ